MALDPPDLKRCQCEWRGGSFMTLGPRPWVRCEKPPTWIGFDETPHADGQMGSMSLCDEHKTICEKQKTDVRFCRIKEVKHEAESGAQS